MRPQNVRQSPSLAVVQSVAFHALSSPLASTLARCSEGLAAASRVVSDEDQGEKLRAASEMLRAMAEETALLDAD